MVSKEILPACKVKQSKGSLLEMSIPVGDLAVGNSEVGTECINRQ